MARPRQIARQQAGAEFNPQISGVRRNTQQQVRSVRSSGPALEASLGRTGQQLRNANLSPQDLAIALREIAHRTADVGASTALQTQQIRQQGQGEITDLLAGRSAAERSILGELQAAEQQYQREQRDEDQDAAKQFKMDILKEIALKKLGLGDYADDGDGGGLTPTQRREAKEEHDNAAFYAKQYFQASKDGITDEEGNVVVPPNPKRWDDTTWNALVEKVAGQEGVDSVEAAKTAVGAIRDHVQGEQPTTGSLLESLGTVATTAAQVLAPKPLQPLAQLGATAMRRRPSY